MEQLRLDFDDLSAFFVVAETGSFARAAERLESSKSIISRRVARLEATLSTRLLQRTARGAHLTEAGTLYYEQARRAMSQLEFAGENLIEATNDLSGPIRLTGPVFFGREYLEPVLAEFVNHYPNIELDVDFSDEKLNLHTEGLDICRPGRPVKRFQPDSPPPVPIRPCGGGQPRLSGADAAHPYAPGPR